MPDSTEGFCPIAEALDELRAGRMIVLVDDENRENEGDLVIAAEKVTPEAINFMVRNGCGILGLSLSPALVQPYGSWSPLPRGAQMTTPRKVALVTGSAVGVGRACALRFAAQGADQPQTDPTCAQGGIVVL